MCVCDDFIEIKDVKPFKRLKRNNVSAGSVLYSSHNAVCFIVAVFFSLFLFNFVNLTSKQVNIWYAYISFSCIFFFLSWIALYELMLCAHSNDIDTDFFLYLFQLAVVS